MNYCGLDVSMKSTHVCIQNEQGHCVKRAVIATSPEALEATLAPYIRRELKVAIEAGGQTAWIVDVLRELGAKVHVVHPVKVKWIAESKKKTDRIDARWLAHLLRIDALPKPVHVPTPRSRELRALLVARRQLVRTRTQLINVVRGLLRQRRVSLGTRGLASRRGWQQLLEAELAPALRDIVKAYDATVRQTTAAVKAIDERLRQRARGDQRITRLQSIPGVGQISAQTLVAAVDRIERFATAKKLAAYSGLVPGVRASGDRVEYGRITKTGRSEIRAVWVQAAHAVLAVKADSARPLQRWCERLAKRRGKKTALVALARKLLTIAFHLLRDGTTYDPRRVRLAA